MSRLDELPPDQRAALSLLLRQRKSYAEVAALLSIPEAAVHDRAHAALAVLAPAQARAVGPGERLQVGDYLLGQQPGVAERLRTRALLAGSEPARVWALTLSGELAHLAGASLPDIPDAVQQVAPAAPAAAAAAPPATAGPAAAPLAAAAPGPAAPPAGAPSAGAPAPAAAASPPAGAPGATDARSVSRVGGAIVLVLIVAAVVGAVIAASSGGGGKGSATTTSTATTTATGPKVDARLPLAPVHTGSRSIGVVEVISEGTRRAFYMRAEHMAPTNGFFYALWLVKASGESFPLGRSPAVGANGVLEGGNLLPSNAAEYSTMLLTRETTPQPAKPGAVDLQGRFSLTG